MATRLFNLKTLVMISVKPRLVLHMQMSCKCSFRDSLEEKWYLEGDEIEHQNPYPEADVAHSVKSQT